MPARADRVDQLGKRLCAEVQLERGISRLDGAVIVAAAYLCQLVVVGVEVSHAVFKVGAIRVYRLDRVHLARREPYDVDVSRLAEGVGVRDIAARLVREVAEVVDVQLVAVGVGVKPLLIETVGEEVAAESKGELPSEEHVETYLVAASLRLAVAVHEQLDPLVPRDVARDCGISVEEVVGNDESGVAEPLVVVDHIGCRHARAGARLRRVAVHLVFEHRFVPSPRIGGIIVAQMKSVFNGAKTAAGCFE